jgi:Uma2 family endonuclease
MLPFIAAGLSEGESELLQGVGIGLPSGQNEYAIPDLSLLDSDFEEHELEHNCYDPAVFRLVLEVTSSNLNDDVVKKPRAYAAAGVPVYVIVDRTERRIVVMTDPGERGYRVHAAYRPGQSFTLPESIGATVKMDVDTILRAGSKKNKP